MKRLYLLLLLCLTSLFGNPRIETLYYSLDQGSIAELLAFYQLYPDTQMGKKALADVWTLLNLHRPKESRIQKNLALPAMDLEAIISLVNKQSFEPSVILSEEQLSIIEMVSDHLHNRTLKGFSIWEKEDVIPLSPDETDLARSLLIYQFESEKEKKLKIRQYEASLDLMTLQILARLPKKATPEEKIHAISQFIFHEKRFRFPPHSLMAKDIDLYTFLPSVLDSRKGVCLGVSILYLSIAQRLGLPLEIITPPGHIYLRYTAPGKEINIETTSRGISLPSKVYLGINTRSLQQRNIKEVIGLAFMNQASVSWQLKDYSTTVKLYEDALPYVGDDPLLKMLLGYNYLFLGEKKKGEKLLKEIQDLTFDYAVYQETTPKDFLNGAVNADGIKAIFTHVDETRDSIVEKQKMLRKVVKCYPLFRDGLLQLAITELQLSQTGEAMKTLCRYHAIDPNNPAVEYYLSIVFNDRLRCKKAWEHLKYAEEITKRRGHCPESLKGLRHHLRALYPDPDDVIQLN